MSRTSPRALLDRFVGSKQAIDAPEWTQWDDPTLKFQQPLATFAALFMKVATWNVNAQNVSLLQLHPSRYVAHKFVPANTFVPDGAVGQVYFDG